MPHPLPFQTERAGIAVFGEQRGEVVQGKLAVAGGHIAVAFADAGRGGAILEVNVDDVASEIGPGRGRRLAAAAPGVMRVPEDLRLRRGSEERPQRRRLGRRVMGFGDELDGEATPCALAGPPGERRDGVADLRGVGSLAAIEDAQPRRPQGLGPFDEGEQRLPIRGAVAAQAKRRADHRDRDRLAGYPVVERPRRTERALELRDEIDGPVEGPQLDRLDPPGLRQRGDFLKVEAWTAQCREAADQYWPGRAGG